MELPDIEPGTLVTVLVVPANVPVSDVDANTARRKANGWPSEAPWPQAGESSTHFVMICHYPTGASRWNPIEHRLFGRISINWARKPLRSFEMMLAYIRGTATETGLKVRAFLLDRICHRGIKVSDREMKDLNLVQRSIYPTWNYVIKPRYASL